MKPHSKLTATFARDEFVLFQLEFVLMHYKFRIVVILKEFEKKNRITFHAFVSVMVIDVAYQGSCSPDSPITRNSARIVPFCKPQLRIFVVDMLKFHAANVWLSLGIKNSWLWLGKERFGLNYPCLVAQKLLEN